MPKLKRTPIKLNASQEKQSPYATIYLWKEGSGDSAECFYINPEGKEGGSCVCYNAILAGQKKSGRLKEFYPLRAIEKNAPYKLERTNANHVVCQAETWEAFQRDLNSFVEPYSVIRQEMLENNNIRNSIPPFTVYYACDEDGKRIEYSTVYIWTEDLETIVFSDYIKSIYKYPKEQPEYKLITILRVINTLTECAHIFHRNNLLLQDIKPENFSVPKRSNKLLTDMVQLFDLDAMTRMGDPPTRGTDGFSAPGRSGCMSCYRDIYSIGCTLFYALIGPERASKGYDPHDHFNITALLDEAPFFTESNTNNHYRVKYYLNKILKYCLNPSHQNGQYSSCVDLQNDLQKVISILSSYEIEQNLPGNMGVQLIDKEENTYQGPGMRLSLLYHLYRHPLFEAYDKQPQDKQLQDKQPLHIMILGFGTYGQEFLDCCMQVGQMRGIKLHVTVVSDDELNQDTDVVTDKTIYFDRRPGFTSEIGQTVLKDYVSITFKKWNVFRDSIEKLLSKCSPVHYIFTALGDDTDNRNITNAILRHNTFIRYCSLNYVAHDSSRQKPIRKAHVIDMRQDITQEDDFQNLERLAFNVHLLWEDCLNINMSKARKKFMERYNYNSSFANAVCVKYRLHDLGLSMGDPNKTAEQYLEKLANSPQNANQSLKNHLMALEHRRWIFEKLCDGYTPITKLETCIEGKTNDKKQKKHICLVSSEASAPLQTAEWQNHEKWDTANAEDISSLDDLDKLSIKLHQIYRNEAELQRNRLMLHDGVVKELRNYTDKCRSTSIAFSEWFSMLSCMSSGAGVPIREYENLKDKLLNSLSELPSQTRKEAQKLLEVLDARFGVIRNSMKYTDWKQIDERLIDGIPFILTYHTELHLAIPFSTGTNTQIFRNVAVPTVVNPKQVTYVYSVTEESFLSDFRKAAAYIFKYLPEKNLRAKIHFVLAYKKSTVTAGQMRDVQQELKTAYSKVGRVILLEADEESNAFDMIKTVLQDTLHVHAFEKNLTGLSGLLDEAGVYEAFPSYSFHIKSKEFYDSNGCNYLNYIRARQYLKASDMFASKDAKGIMRSPLTFYKNYEALWNTYREHKPAWKRLCALLEQYHEGNTVVSIQTDSCSSEKDGKEYYFLRPTECYAGADKLISFLVAANVFGSKSSVFHSSPNHCEIRIYAAASLENTIHRLFSDPNLLSHPDSIFFMIPLERNKKATEILVRHDQLEVKGLELSREEHAESIMDLLRVLTDRFSFLYSLNEFPEGSHVISFRYSTRQVKRLLTSADSILKDHLYLKCLTSGYFDDVTAGYQVLEDDNSLSDEFDMVVTKGFNSLMIDVKNSETIAPSVYSDLIRRADWYGTCSRAVLVADTEGDAPATLNADMEYASPDQSKSVYTVFNSDDIHNIDRTLLALLEQEQEQEREVTSAKHGSRIPSRPL